MAKLTRAEANAKFVKLSWEILEDKFRYYHGEEHGLKPIPDTDYDKKEALYKKLAEALKLPPTACSHVGFPFDTPSGKLVKEKLLMKTKRP